MADEEERALREFAIPMATPSPIRRPPVMAKNFEIKPAVITMLQNSSMLFPFSLKDKAKLWLLSQLQDSIHIWDDLSKNFLAKFFHQAKTSKFQQDIMSFTQYDKEPLYESWERFKEEEAEKSQEEENYAAMPTPFPPLNPYVSPIPFLQRLKKNKIDGLFPSFLETFKKL
ncbi:hypothetical protein L3X38_035451 [Prunus dulcis]|uniref:Retrotransposon gag domain-containing protein n=1 Tax=Prunus dulcis TaxID=3755 RepID=A0AAD4YXU0_PRUDU|nr:hypothetical protein L3X38_035451 [Prunus dulcis]